VRRYFGYCLTGHVSEQVFLYLFGKGGNGKNLLTEAIAEIMGGYARNMDISTLQRRGGDKHMSELAVLNGARFVRTSEPDRESKWNESRLKNLTGDAVVTANLKHKDEVEMNITFKLAVLANPAPTFDDVGESMQRRLVAIFIPQPAKRDMELKAKLRAEYPAILRWLVDGAVDWYQGGLRVPESIIEASKNHLKRAHSDVRAWINERCRRDGTATGTEIQLSWEGYAKASLSTTNRSPSWLRAELEKEGIRRRLSNGVKYDGISVKSARGRLGSPLSWKAWKAAGRHLEATPTIGVSCNLRVLREVGKRGRHFRKSFLYRERPYRRETCSLLSTLSIINKNKDLRLPNCLPTWKARKASASLPPPSPPHLTAARALRRSPHPQSAGTSLTLKPGHHVGINARQAKAVLRYVALPQKQVRPDTRRAPSRTSRHGRGLLRSEHRRQARRLRHAREAWL
jgi:P4 family phage/plasmid primase-like protien